jgi:hypothetical protein
VPATKRLWNAAAVAPEPTAHGIGPRPKSFMRSSNIRAVERNALMGFAPSLRAWARAWWGPDLDRGQSRSLGTRLRGCRERCYVG